MQSQEQKQIKEKHFKEEIYSLKYMMQNIYYKIYVGVYNKDE
jgi:hypothetical protein